MKNATASIPATARLALAAALAFAGAGHAGAQGVFKCNVDGKTTYQSTPCAGQGKALELQKGPSEQQVKEAQSRANAEQSRAAQADTRRRLSQPEPARVANTKVDCAALDKQRGDAYGRRNATVRASRQENIDQSGAVNRYQADIQRIEGQMARAGC